eukprot:GHVL01007032.1.p1 GENE.GHVL01007032.1~~GHVL01007032.1.p1  ORF type:complete len:324 (+),score=63.19 GHVL01007032.1:207-1178(+)
MTNLSTDNAFDLTVLHGPLSYKVSIKPSQTIKELKEIIYSTKKDLKPCHELRILNEDFIQLDDSSLISDNKLTIGSIVILHESITLHIKDYIHEKKNAEYYIDMFPLDKVECLFLKLKKILPNISNSSKLIYGEKIELEPEYAISYYKIKDKDIITMTESHIAPNNAFNLVVHHGTKSFKVEIKPSQTILKLKELIYELNEDCQNIERLRVLSENYTNLDDSKKVSDCKLTVGSSVILHECLSLFISDNGYQTQMTHVIDMWPLETVACLKSKIEEATERFTGAMRLNYNGHELSPEKTISHYKMKDRDTISMVVRQRGGFLI